jgi:radical SAM protein with 4Fe4S-binding SPASM domain
MEKLFLDGHKLLYHLDVVEQWLKGEDIIPIHVEISPTSLCNQRCRFCYRDFDGHKANILKPEVFLNLIKSLAKLGVKSVLLAGDGEPTLNKATPEAIVLGRKLGMDMALNSNGILFPEEISRQILPCLTWLRFSIMSANPQHYASIHGVPEEQLTQAVENIRKCVEIKKREKLAVTLGIQQVLLEDNGGDVYELAKLCKQIGVDYYVLKPFSKHPSNIYDSSTDLHIKYEDELKKAESLSDANFKVLIRWNTFSDKGERDYDKCLGIPFILQVGADGGIYSCCPLFGQPRFLFGNLYESSFEEILSSQRRKEVIKDIAENVNVHECMTYCRHHQINRFLWKLVNRPQHVNFI